MIQYDKMITLLKKKRVTKSEMGKILGISSRTIAKISKGEKLSFNVLKKIADYLSCSVDELYEVVSDNKILQRLKEEKQFGISGGLYHELQVRMTYNSNHIEGSTLTEDQTRLIFETKTIDGDGILVDDILETVHHFRAIDYCIDKAEEKLSEDMIKHIHYILKHDTEEDSLDWFMVGNYKKRENMVGGMETTPVKDVSKEMKQLLMDYHKKSSITIQDIIEFHVCFEKIHPFQDGNGRVGRLIAFKECLNHNIVPFIIEDSKKMYYYRGLSKWDEEKGYLMDTCLDGQDSVYALLKMLHIE